jgi:hypothetical protein
MVLPGIQALFGFQLIAVFNERFKELTEDEQLIHFSATILVTIAIALIMTPAAYHRLAEQTTISKFFVWLASWLIAAAMVPLMLGLTLEVHVWFCRRPHFVIAGHQISDALAFLNGRVKLHTESRLARWLLQTRDWIDRASRSSRSSVIAAAPERPASGHAM